MKKLLVDAGPLIALFDKHDQYHKRVLAQVKRFEEIMHTTWPVITEVSHMLNFNLQAQIDFLEWISLGGLEIANLSFTDLERILDLTKMYENVPMDLADASLVVLSEHLRTNRILSIDSDFQIFQNRFKDYLMNELE